MVATAGVLVASVVGGFGWAQRIYVILRAVWVLLAAVAVLRDVGTET